MAGFVSYIRVSTQKQGQSGLGLAAQQEAVARHLGTNVPLAEFVEVESGKRSTNRPQLMAALDMCKRKKATLLIAKLDRLARNVHFISGLMESGVDFIAVDMPTANRLTVHIMAAFAEHEAAMISARTKAALAAAKAQGTVLGNPRWQEGIAKARQVKNPAKLATAVVEMMKQHQAEGLTLRAIADKMNGLGVRTPSGCIWYAGTVRKAMMNDAA
jgi:DNA invertase Pin-like site-specific DNA recombinase